MIAPVRKPSSSRWRTCWAAVATLLLASAFIAVSIADEAHAQSGMEPGNAQAAPPRVAMPKGLLHSRPPKGGAFPARVTAQDAARFLNQATFGARPQDMAELIRLGYQGWFDKQVKMPPTVDVLAEQREVSNFAAGAIPPHYGELRGNPLHTNEGIWKAFVQGPDQLRQRLVFTYSHIFTVSGGDTFWDFATVLAGWVDMLSKNAFANYRTLLEEVTLHPAMGMMLSHMYNQKGDTKTGRMPDQNFAREVMQLFSIGLWQLNIDGSTKLVNGEPVPTYTQADVEGLSRVMTGFAWARQPDNWSVGMDPWESLDFVSMTSPMKGFAAYHEADEKRFLGVTISASSKANPAGDLKIMLDTLFNHPNVGPFIGKQMIQRMVTSNPSPGYVARVAKAFNDNGKGVRGDMTAVIRAILADEEARSLVIAARPTYGRIREPILRFAHIQRLLNATDTDGLGFHQNNWEDPLRGIAQQPFRPQNVFGFSRPNYAPPGSELIEQGLVAPEMQMATETSVYGWWSSTGGFLDAGGFGDCCSDAQRRTLYLKLDFSGWTPFAKRVPRLVDRLDLLLTGKQMSKTTRDAIIAHVYEQDGAHLAYGFTGLKWPMDRLRVIRAFHAAFISTDYVVQR